MRRRQIRKNFKNDRKWNYPTHLTAWGWSLTKRSISIHSSETETKTGSNEVIFIIYFTCKISVPETVHGGHIEAVIADVLSASSECVTQILVRQKVWQIKQPQTCPVHCQSWEILLHPTFMWTGGLTCNKNVLQGKVFDVESLSVYFNHSSSRQ